MEQNSFSPQELRTSSNFPLKGLKFFFSSDPRHYQIAFLTSFLIYGNIFLGWDNSLLKIILTFSVCIFTQLIFTAFTNRDFKSVKSALISALSICLMLKTNLMLTVVLASVLSIAGKFIIRIDKKHVFNPTNFGIILTLILTQDAWISTGQWGNGSLMVFLLGALGMIVLLKVNRFDTAIAFIAAFALYHYFRSVVYLGWTTDVFLQQMTSGTLMIFTFFMITDPKSTPSSFKARIIWASMVGVLAAYLQIHHWVNGSALWALFILSPLTPLFDQVFSGEKFQWFKNENSSIKQNSTSWKLHNVGKGVVAIVVLLVLSLPLTSNAFCGFYVAKADATLFNKSSQVIIVRDEDHTVITMSSDYSGELQDFAMVVPVPVVLSKSDIRVVERVLFDSFDAYSGPRLVEYWDQNPCWNSREQPSVAKMSSAREVEESASDNDIVKDEHRVKIEAQYVVGEYDILILSAKESGGLESWLIENGYRIPTGAKGVLEPYIKSGMKFFVVKVNLEGYHKGGNNLLRPLQIAFHSPKFMLPIRLGMANSKDSQDMIVYALTRTGRVETANYRTVNMPTDRKVPEFVKDNFSEFYKNTYETTVKREGKRNVFLEYAWDISGSNFMKCDPCASNPPVFSDLIDAGATWIQNNRNGTYSGSVYFTRLHVTYDRANFAQDLVFQETPNKQNFQARYILTHAAPGPFECKEGKAYLQELRKRRYHELQELNSLTGWDIKQYGDYLNEVMGYALPKEPVIKKNPVVIDAPKMVMVKKKVNADTVIAVAQVSTGHQDSIVISNSAWEEIENRSEAGTPAADTDIEVILAVVALGALYFISRRRRQV